MTRYRRRVLKPEESVATAVTSALLGVGTAALAYYLTRLFLAREPLVDRWVRGRDSARDGQRDHPALPSGSAEGLIDDGSASEVSAPRGAGGHDPGS